MESLELRILQKVSRVNPVLTFLEVGGAANLKSGADLTPDFTMLPHWGLQYPSPAPSGEDAGAAELLLLPNVPGQATSLGRDQR